MKRKMIWLSVAILALTVLGGFQTCSGGKHAPCPAYDQVEAQ